MELTLILFTILIGALLIGVLLFGKRGGGGARGGNKLLLFGPMGAGKTALYHQLRYGRAVPTLTSMQKSDATFVFHAERAASPRPAAVHVVDMPGTGRLRSQLLAEAAASSVLCCMVDATKLSTHAKEAAGMIFDVLSLEAVERRQPTLVVALNKTDLPGCASAQTARTLLAAEIQKVRLARTTLQDTAGAARAGGIGDRNAPAFTFEGLRGGAHFVGTSATQPNLGALTQLVRKHLQ